MCLQGSLNDMAPCGARVFASRKPEEKSSINLPKWQLKNEQFTIE